MEHKSKTIHEAFARFFEQPGRDTFRTLLKDHVGELRNCDFKETWPERSGLARHVLGFGNSGGGCPIAGIRENADKSTDPIGLASITDKVDITNAIKSYIPASLLDVIEIGDFKFDASEYPKLLGKCFQVMFISPRASDPPFVSVAAGADIRAATIYVRREGSTAEANHDEIQKIIAARLASAGVSQQARDLKEHLAELQILYAEIPRTLTELPMFAALATSIMGFPPSRRNPNYPQEDYQAFVLRIISAKKALIEKLTGVAR